MTETVSLMPTSAAIESRLAAIAIEKRELISLLKTVKRIESRRSAPLPLFPEADSGAGEPAGAAEFADTAAEVDR